MFFIGFLINWVLCSFVFTEGHLCGVFTGFLSPDVKGIISVTLSCLCVLSAFFTSFCKSESFLFFSVIPPLGYWSTGRMAQMCTRGSLKTTLGMWVFQHKYLCKSANQSCWVSVWLDIQEHNLGALTLTLDFMMTGCFSAGCDPTKLPGSVEGRLLENQRWLRKSFEKASDKIKPSEAAVNLTPDTRTVISCSSAFSVTLSFPWQRAQRSCVCVLHWPWGTWYSGLS